MRHPRSRPCFQHGSHLLHGDADMELPPGKHCGECMHWGQSCSYYIQQPELAVECDWAPSRFVEKERKAR
jgi:hypothetical protein